MKLVRFGPSGQEKPGALDRRGRLRDLSSRVSDWSGAALDPSSLAKLAKLDLAKFPEVDAGVRIGACVGDVRKIVCIGLNYADHAAETGAEVPAEPMIFLKASLPTGPYDDVPLPRGSLKSDWEVELGVVIGRRATHVDAAEALDYVAGYCVTNDLSEREWQLEGTGTWDKGKGCDGFGPIGPWLVTRDEVRDVQDLSVWLDLNGCRMQDSSTRQMVHRVGDLVSYVSRFMSLHPGDVISTGTPPGVGLGMKPQRFLREGDVMELGIEGLGFQRQKVVAPVAGEVRRPTQQRRKATA
jgi:2,4-diketo-3-deoxy-L-fuconate hydrolase